MKSARCGSTGVTCGASHTDGEGARFRPAARTRGWAGRTIGEVRNETHSLAGEIREKRRTSSPLSCMAPVALEASRRLASSIRARPTAGLSSRSSPPSNTQKQLDESIVNSCGSGCQGTWKMIALANQTPAVLIAAPGASDGVLWLRRGVLFDVYGPASSFSVADADAVAGMMIQAGA